MLCLKWLKPHQHNSCEIWVRDYVGWRSSGEFKAFGTEPVGIQGPMPQRWINAWFKESALWKGNHKISVDFPFTDPKILNITGDLVISTIPEQRYFNDAELSIETCTLGHLGGSVS